MTQPASQLFQIIVLKRNGKNSTDFLKKWKRLEELVQTFLKEWKRFLTFFKKFVGGVWRFLKKEARIPEKTLQE